jgi:hypothetical protein
LGKILYPGGHCKKEKFEAKFEIPPPPPPLGAPTTGRKLGGYSSPLFYLENTKTSKGREQIDYFAL